MMLSFPTELTNEEKELKGGIEKLKKLRKSTNQQAHTSPSQNKEGSKSKLTDKKATVEAEMKIAEIKKKVVSGAIKIDKTEEKQSFKRSQKRKPSESCDMDENEFGLDGDGSKYAEKSKSLLVHGDDLNREILRKAFEKFGEITSIELEEDQRNNACITFSAVDMAENALIEMDGKRVDSVDLHVSFQKSRKKRLKESTELTDSHDTNDFSITTPDEFSPPVTVEVKGLAKNSKDIKSRSPQGSSSTKPSLNKDPPVVKDVFGSIEKLFSQTSEYRIPKKVSTTPSGNNTPQPNRSASRLSEFDSSVERKRHYDNSDEDDPNKRSKHDSSFGGSGGFGSKPQDADEHKDLDITNSGENFGGFGQQSEVSHTSNFGSNDGFNAGSDNNSNSFGGGSFGSNDGNFGSGSHQREFGGDSRGRGDNRGRGRGGRGRGNRGRGGGHGSFGNDSSGGTTGGFGSEDGNGGGFGSSSNQDNTDGGSGFGGGGGFGGTFGGKKGFNESSGTGGSNSGFGNIGEGGENSGNSGFGGGFGSGSKGSNSGDGGFGSSNGNKQFGNDQQRGRGDRGPMTCFNCNQTGHMSRECPEPKKPRGGGTSGGGGGRGPPTCFNCQEVGHMSRECTKPRQNSGRGRGGRGGGRGGSRDGFGGDGGGGGFGGGDGGSGGGFGGGSGGFGGGGQSSGGNGGGFGSSSNQDNTDGGSGFGGGGGFGGTYGSKKGSNESSGTGGSTSGFGNSGSSFGKQSGRPSFGNRSRDLSTSYCDLDAVDGNDDDKFAGRFDPRSHPRIRAPTPTNEESSGDFAGFGGASGFGGGGGGGFGSSSASKEKKGSEGRTFKNGNFY